VADLRAQGCRRGDPNGVADQPAAILSASEPVTLRGIRFQLVEEARRHNGRLDILREVDSGVEEGVRGWKRNRCAEQRHDHGVR
jgi:hypothetical protein